MRFPLVAAALLSLASGCMPVHRGHHHAHHAHHAHRGEVVADLVVGGIWLIGMAAAHTAEGPAPTVPAEPPAPVVVVPHVGAFDSVGTKQALRAVDYKDCGTGGAAKLVLVFGSSGSVLRAGIVEGKLAPETERCVLSRFQAVRVRPFAATEHAVSWRIWVPTALDTDAAEPEPTWM